MARGTPDWYRGFEIFGGGVRLYVAPSYGPATRSIYSDLPDAAEWVELVLVEGQGMTYGGWLEAYGDGPADQDWIRLEVDGNLLISTQFQDLYSAGMDGKADLPLFITSYDTVNYRYCISFKRGMTFDESYRVLYYRNSADLTGVNVRLIYALAPV